MSTRSTIFLIGPRWLDLHVYRDVADNHSVWASICWRDRRWLEFRVWNRKKD